MSKSRGFTLIELMVAFTIIAVLSAIGLVVYSSVLKQGRDSKRQSDLRSIQSAVEQYFADQFYYPSAITFNGGALSAGGKTYLNTVPVDPLNSNAYSYVPTSSGYCIYANLENASPGKPTACTGSGNFAVSPP